MPVCKDAFTRARQLEAQLEGAGTRIRRLEAELEGAAARIRQLEAQLEDANALNRSRTEDCHLQCIARLPRATCYREFALVPLLATDARRAFIEQLVTRSCVRHRKELQSPEFCDPPVLQVEAVEQVVNGRLLREYSQSLEGLEGLRRLDGCAAVARLLEPLKLPAAGGEPDLNEVLLFHGSTAAGVGAIARGGFDLQRGGEGTGKLFGIATYFSPNASKSDIYTEEQTSRLPRCAARKMFVARVALGESHRVLRGTPGAHRAPDNFDSVWADSRENGGCVEHLEVMIYAKGQAIPVFLVTYTHARACRCAECPKRPAS